MKSLPEEAFCEKTDAHEKYMLKITKIKERYAQVEADKLAALKA